MFRDDHALALARQPASLRTRIVHDHLAADPRIQPRHSGRRLDLEVVGWRTAYRPEKRQRSAHVARLTGHGRTIVLPYRNGKSFPGLARLATARHGPGTV